MNGTQPLEARTLDTADIESILVRNSIGRLAFIRGGRIDILPIQYVYRGGSIYGRTAEDGKLREIDGDGTEVAFEVDEIRSHRSWSSVLVHGTFHLLVPQREHEEWLRALGILRRVQKSALRGDDEHPERTQLFRIIVSSATGRACC